MPLELLVNACGNNSILRMAGHHPLTGGAYSTTVLYWRRLLNVIFTYRTCLLATYLAGAEPKVYLELLVADMIP